MSSPVINAMEENQTIPDAELVTFAKAGELSAFEDLVRRYEGLVYSLTRRILQNEQDAEDVTQQTFLSALEHLDNFREEASFKTWLLRIATHAALKVIRKRKGLASVSLEEATEDSNGHDSIPHPEYIADCGSRRSYWWNRTRPIACSTKPWPNLTRSIDLSFSYEMWRECRLRKPVTRSS
jgi:RNA polymerase sigma factor (sigma-70 family)